MSEELFSIPEQPASELAQARIRFDKANSAYDEYNEFTAPPLVWLELKNARFHLTIAEQRELERVKRA